MLAKISLLTRIINALVHRYTLIFDIAAYLSRRFLIMIVLTELMGMSTFLLTNSLLMVDYLAGS